MNQKTRLLLPDFARGLALLGIAIANVLTIWCYYDDGFYNRLSVTDYGAIHYQAGIQQTLDKVTIVLAAMFAHVRGLPMFSTLLGYGIGLILMRELKAGARLSQARMVLIRRYAFLALFGALHAIFLFSGDIMLLYGGIAVLLSFTISLSDKWLLVIAGIFFALISIITVGNIIFFLDWNNSTAIVDDPSLVGGPGSYPEQLLFGLIVVVSSFIRVPAALFSFGPVIILGFVAARRNVLTRIDRYRRHLYVWAAIYVVIVFGIGLPWGLSMIGVIPGYDIWGELNSSLGVLTGPGFLALLALLFDRITTDQKPQTWMKPFIALGKRSMSGYLLQSVFFFIIVNKYTLHQGVNASAWKLVAIAFGVWLATFIIAGILEKLKKPGPFEWLHRKIGYGKPKAYTTFVLSDLEQIKALEYQRTGSEFDFARYVEKHKEQPVTTVV
ncbi:DUF418 domain-containing protein [Corynebacterium sp. sy017]|uniref:DUF418 domain-containing protein n=1 Tax=unclassified Corynebacterium TaxID=2624378 RepID=UPI001185698A|nr:MULTISPECIES: DUF418 domain-containing protein [unclassified Corynebacterium]MBP3087756.1 DUF418 domain-containing protein [Corynebacterium sp. sy017]TSD92306.1 DUF418 domain-containing protein [Corynebacterium sp. SY003]